VQSGELTRKQEVIAAVGDQVARLEARAALIEGIERRLAEIKEASDELDRHQQAIASREQLVSAVKGEVETVHLISARARADFDYVAEHRGEVAALKAQVDHLLSRIADANQAITELALKTARDQDVKPTG
jgi:prefoldin subunit 5